MERLGRWLARRPWEMADQQDLEERVEAVVTRVDGLEQRVEQLEETQEPRSDGAK
jgi:hypothetical protein